MKLLSLIQGLKTAPRWWRVSICTILSLFLLLLLLWIIAAWYLHYHKKDFLNKITQKAEESIHGQVRIDDISLSFGVGFPNLVIHLKNLVIQDKQHNLHQRDLIHAQDVFITIGIPSLISRRPDIKKISVSEAEIYLFKDTSDYANFKILKKKNKDFKTVIGRFEIDNLLFTFDHFGRNKQIKFFVKNLKGKSQVIDNEIIIETDIDAYIYQLGFQLKKGGFAKNANFQTKKIRLLFDTEQKILTIPDHLLYVDSEEINFFGQFDFTPFVSSYIVKISGEQLDFKETKLLLSRHLQHKFEGFYFSKPISIKTLIKGSLIPPDTPIVEVAFRLEYNDTKTPIGDFEQLTTHGSYTNKFAPGVINQEESASVRIDSLQARWAGIPFKADNVQIHNLKNPILQAHIKSEFEVEKLNNIVGKTFRLKNGKVKVDINYSGSLIQTDNEERKVNGHVQIHDAVLSYLPRNLNFKRCNALLKFEGEDLVLEQIELNSQKSSIKMKGIAKNFLSVYFADPDKVVFNCQVQSEHLDLNEFRSFIEKRNTTNKNDEQAKETLQKISRINKQIDNILDRSRVFLEIYIKNVSYNNFRADNFKAGITLLQNGIELNNILINHAGGSFSLKGKIQQHLQDNPFEFHSHISKLNVEQIFYAFDNFGLDVLTHENMRGTFSGDIALKGKMQEDGVILKNTLEGKINFALKNGALINFKPLEAIQKYAFKKRNLSNLSFATISSQLTINQGVVHIPPTLISTNALVMTIHGKYGLEKGTDIGIEAPLRNPQKEIERHKKGLPTRKNKGIVVYLRAKDNQDGKINLSWDPLKKGWKNTTVQQDADDD